MFVCLQDLLCVIAYGPQQSRPYAVSYLFHYWPQLNPSLTDRRGVHFQHKGTLHATAAPSALILGLLPIVGGGCYDLVVYERTFCKYRTDCTQKDYVSGFDFKGKLTIVGCYTFAILLVVFCFCCFILHLLFL